MKTLFSFLFVAFLFQPLLAQETKQKPFSIGVSSFYGYIFEHNTDISHLIEAHPTGVLITYNRKTFGANLAERQYNYPDWGFTFGYQNSHSETLGDQYALYAHYNWYFLKRNLLFSAATGVSYATNPFDKETNFSNNAYGTRFLSTTIFKLNYVRENLWKGFGLQAGLSFIHYSNANFRAPNTSTNSVVFNAGINYLFYNKQLPEYIASEETQEKSFSEQVKINAVLRYGWNESDVIGQGHFPFYVFSSYVDKRISYKNTLQIGVDVFFSDFLKELIRYRSIAYPEDGLTGTEDYRRLGMFIGHEFRFHKNAFMTQLGYYVYWPYEFEDRVYNRLGIKRYFFDGTMFGTISVKSQWAKAEGFEFGIGIRM
ncbi:acyloxyacyl hydrolase [Ulvibacter litoralis]|uniref:Lipid A 3-O-deacylase (PagL) n=1 Tax=Ulvibacter litoralis TaxID=227084 RepID=A0A1G7C589_9FLAO|nr:acyloxyacyl hydrolase [Ulvibacter litoralis]SDE34544.1 Lipid A 3-O-deacylase (PagL) [Ulvibacter litoralis]